MRKEHKYLLLIVTLLAIGVGYAFLRTELNINGTAIIKDAKWNIHFENYQMTSNSTITPNSEPVITGDTTTEISYNITFEEPGDVYEFTVDIKNGGTLTAEVSSLETSIMIDDNELSTIPNYLNYSVTYSNGDEYVTPHNLSSGDKETVLVRVEFKRDITADDLLEIAGKALRFGLRTFAVQGDDSQSLPEDGVYVYTVTPNLRYNIGEEMPSGAVLYSNYQDLNRTSFLRHKVVDGIIVKTDVGFIYNGNVYFVPPYNYDDYNSYMASYNSIASVVGEENCEFHDGGSDFECISEIFTYSGNNRLIMDNGYERCEVYDTFSEC